MRLALAFALALSACADVEQEKLARDTRRSNVVTTEITPGVVTGKLKADAGATQRLVASKLGSVAETWIEVPAGALQIDTDLTLQDGDPSSGAVGEGTLPSELGAPATVTVVDAAAPLLVSANSGVDPLKPIVVNLPLPLTASGHFALLYHLRSSTGNQVGLHIVGASDLVGGVLRFQATHFGWFRLLTLSAEAVPIEPKATQRDPAPSP